VQTSKLRAFTDKEYSQAGAQVVSDTTDAEIILSIKEVGISALREGKVHSFFSHTFKGQPYNMPMLREILNRSITLIDYEKITDDHGRRLVYFGNWAGYAGIVDTLRGFGLRKAREGVATPFADIRPTYEYGSLSAVRNAMSQIGRIVGKDGLPAQVVPLSIGIAGYGNVSRGAQEMLDELPTKRVSPQELLTLDKGTADPRVVYVSVFHEEDTVRRRDGGPFSLDHYLSNPTSYESVFAKYLPHLSILVNAVYWSAEYPRLVSDRDIARLYQAGGQTRPKLSVIGDISCDIEGAIECTKISTAPDAPCYVWDPAKGDVEPGVHGHGPVIMAVDNLPCELPRESSTTFGGSLQPFLGDLADADFSVPFAELELPRELKRAVIAHRGRLTPDYAYLREYLNTTEGEP
jgi:alpha-aminoadipic semialdehyde synthase